MSFGTVLLVLGTGLLIFLVTLQLLRRGRIPVKFSILWFIVAVILLVVGIFPNFIVLISTRITEKRAEDNLSVMDAEGAVFRYI